MNQGKNMNTISGWDEDYLDHAENRRQLEHFLQEQDNSNLLGLATDILRNRKDTLSFGFVAGRAIHLDSSGRKVHNPLYPLWGLLRQRARDILNAPSFDDPLGYAYLDYRLAVWVLSIVGVPTDIHSCLRIYEKYKDDSAALASDVATTIMNLGQQSANLPTDVQKTYEAFLLEELRLYPEDNLSAIRGLSLDSAESAWMPYLNRVQETPNLNKKLNGNVLFFLLQSSLPSVVYDTIALVQCFFENQRKQHTLYHFFEQTTEEERVTLKSYLDKSTVAIAVLESLDALEVESLGKTANSAFHVEHIAQLPRLFTSKKLYRTRPEEQATDVLRATYEHVIHNCDNFGMFFSFLLFLSQSQHKKLIEHNIEQVRLMIDKRHDAQEFPLNSSEFMALIN